MNRRGRIFFPNGYSIATFTIVFTARQLNTHSKNVSLLCFLCTKGGLTSLLVNTDPGYKQQWKTLAQWIENKSTAKSRISEANNPTVRSAFNKGNTGQKQEDGRKYDKDLRILADFYNKFPQESVLVSQSYIRTCNSCTKVKTELSHWKLGLERHLLCHERYQTETKGDELQLDTFLREC